MPDDDPVDEKISERQEPIEVAKKAIRENEELLNCLKAERYEREKSRLEREGK